MLDINEIVLKAVGKLDIEKIVEEKVKKTVEETIKSIMEDIFRSYSDFGQELKTKIKEKTKVNFDKLDIPSYNMIVSKVVEDCVKGMVNTEAADKIKTQVERVITGDTEKEYKLSEILNLFKENMHDDYKYEDETECSIIMDDSDTYLTDKMKKYIHLYLDPKADKKKYECAYQIDISPDSEIYGLKIKNRDAVKDFYVGKVSKWEGLILRIKANEAKIIVDMEKDEIDTYYNSEGDDD